MQLSPTTKYVPMPTAYCGVSTIGSLAVTAALSRMPRAEGFNVRDRAMYEAFQWHAARLAPGSKIIVWCATIHAAKDLRGIADAESLIPPGWYLHRDLGEPAAAIGFSAQAGSWARVRPSANRWPSPPLIRSRVSPRTGRCRRALLRSQRARTPLPVANRAMSETFSRVRWAQAVDGMVMFREEHPPRFVRGTRPQRVS